MRLGEEHIDFKVAFETFVGTDRHSTLSLLLPLY
jgi:hypothetical protein